VHHHSHEELLDAVERLSKVNVLVVGDLILDRYVWGRVERISPEAPVPIVDVTRIEDRLGGAGNVVRNLRQLGVAVSVCGFVGDDQDGSTLLSLLAQEGLSRDGVLIDRSRPTTLKTRVIAHAQQVVRIDREKKGLRELPLREGFAAVVDAHIDECDALVVSDYGKGTISNEVMQRIARAYETGRLGIRSRPVVVDPHPANYENYRCITIAKPNRKEAEIATGVQIVDTESAFLAARRLKDRWEAEMMMVTLGEDGLVIVGPGPDDALSLPTRAVEVFDVSGAGDTVTAVFAAAMASGSSPSVSGELANIAAGIVVSEIGTFAITAEQLKDGIRAT
jgi:rfaE bifunctional protein kinase chain/domain